VEGYVDADWASDRNDWKSCTGFTMLFNTSPVSWVSWKQKTVATSVTEAEYMALSDAAKQICWIKSLLEELSFDIPPVVLYEDNMGSILLAQNPAQERRMKHIDIRHHFIRECIVTHQTCLVLWTWRKLADELMQRMHPRSVERLS